MSYISEVSTTTFAPGAPSVNAIPDNLRNSKVIPPIASHINGQHPLQTRLAKYEDTQNEIRMENIRRVVGPGEAIRRSMEIEFVKNTGFVPNIMGGPSKVHQDILENREARVDWEDIYQDDQGITNFNLHSEMRKQMGL